MTTSRPDRDHDQPRHRPAHPPARRPEPGGRAAATLRLQRQVGNAATTRAVTALQRDVDPAAARPGWDAAVQHDRWDDAARMMPGWDTGWLDRYLEPLNADQLSRLADATRRVFRDREQGIRQRVEYWQARRAPTPEERERERVAATLRALDAGDGDVDSLAARLDDRSMVGLAVDPRARLIAAIGRGTLVGDEDETTITRLIRTTPEAQGTELLARLRSGGSALFRELDSAIDGEEIRGYQSALCDLALRAGGPEETARRMHEARQIVWGDPTVLQAMTTHLARTHADRLEWTPAGRIVLDLRLLVGPLFSVVQHYEFDPTELISVRFVADEPEVGAAEGEVLFLPAVNLWGLQHKQFRQEMGTAVDVALLAAGGTGLVAAGSRAAKLLAALDLLLSATDITVRSFRPQITAMAGGPEFLRAWDSVQKLIMVYTLARVVLAAPTAFQRLRETFGRVRPRLAGGPAGPVEQQVDHVLQDAATVEQEARPGGAPAVGTAEPQLSAAQVEEMGRGNASAAPVPAAGEALPGLPLTGPARDARILARDVRGLGRYVAPYRRIDADYARLQARLDQLLDRIRGNPAASAEVYGQLRDVRAQHDALWGRIRDLMNSADDQVRASYRQALATHQLEQGARRHATLDAAEPFGATDDGVRRALGMTGNTQSADILAYGTPPRWIIAEGKGTDVEHAVEQFQNTVDHLPAAARRTGRAVPTVANTEFRIYLRPEQYARFTTAEGLNGYRVRGGVLYHGVPGGGFQEAEVLIGGQRAHVRVFPFAAPAPTSM